MADDIAQWLEGLGLGEYAEEFEKNAIELRDLPFLSDDDLTGLGLRLGHRRRLQAAIKALDAGDPVDPELGKRTRSGSADPGDAERRQLTVLFCDLVGSTALSSRLDPEDMRDVLQAYQDACAGVIGRYDGYVAKFMGDGVYAYFGYPRAHEDDAERAINAGLAIVDAVGALDSDLKVRIGIATGTVAVGDMVGVGASEKAAIVGEPPNLAARLQEIAEPNTVVIGEATHVLAGGLFETRGLGLRDLKGFSAPTGAWTVIRPRRTQNRFEATHSDRLTPLVGREEEMEILLRRWRRAEAGEGQVVLISGEPGIGKSRLALSLEEQISSEPHFRLRYQCSPYHTGSALHPFIEQLEQAARIETADSAETRLDKMEALLARSGRPIDHAASLIAALLSLPADRRYPPLAVSPQRRKELTLQALVAQLSGLAAQRPVLFEFEDAHWIDPTSLELLALIIEHVPKLAALVLITHRSEFDAPWIGYSHVTQMSLRRLNDHDSLAMVEQLALDARLPEAVRARIARQTDGIPLFVEELTKSVLDTASGSAMINVPATLQDALEARLDRLGSAREVAQIGAVIGRTFEYALLSEIASSEGIALTGLLEDLVRSDLLTVRGTPPNATYAFKHALVQDTAYRSLLRRRRSELHGRIAEVLERRFPEIVETRPETLAYHYTEGGHTGTAIAYWRRAGQRAAERSADVEASEHFRKALELLQNTPDDVNRQEQELEILIALGPVLMNVRGSASIEVRDVYSRACELCDHAGQPAQRFPVLWGLWLHHHMAGDSDAALRLAHEAINLAKQLSDPDLLLQAHHATWTTEMRLGHFGAVVEHADRGLELYDLERHRTQSFTYGGHDAGVCAGALSAHAAWFLGYPEQGLKRSFAALSLARETAHPFSIAHALSYAAMLRLLRREPEESLKISDELISFSTENGLAIWRANGNVLWGWARSLVGKSAEQVEGFRAAVKQREKTGSRLRHSIHLAELAYALSLIGSEDEARTTIEQALQEVEETGERSWEALIHWIDGEIHAAASGDSDAQAVACYQRARDVAQRQRAKTIELRAVTRLAQFASKEGRRQQARDLLAPIYGWFTEGFDTVDLKEAKAVLDGLT